VRQYFAAAEDVIWDLSPSARNLTVDHAGHSPALPAT
jgi:hypothetical protein